MEVNKLNDLTGVDPTLIAEVGGAQNAESLEVFEIAGAIKWLMLRRATDLSFPITVYQTFCCM